MGHKFYAVRKGKQCNQIYTTWDEAKACIDGFPGAVYRGFNSREDAEKYIAGQYISNGKWYGLQTIDNKAYVFDSWDACKEFQQNHTCVLVPKGFKSREEAEAYANGEEPVPYLDRLDKSLPTCYIDGSEKDGRIGWGMYLEFNSESYQFFGQTAGDMGSVTGEIAAFSAAYKACLSWIKGGKEEFKHINLVYDYAGIEKWLDGSWKAKKPESKLFKQFFDVMQEQMGDDKLIINFYKVPSHTGVRGNEEADRLAKQATREGTRFADFRTLLSTDIV